MELERLERTIDQRAMAVRGFDVCSITYEDLNSNQEQTCNRVLSFLGVQPSGLLQSKYVKIMPNELEAAIENYGEVCQTLSNTRFEYLLAE